MRLLDEQPCYGTILKIYRILCIPRGGVKLKRKNDVVHVADLADEASLSAEVAMMHVLAGELDERLQEGLVLAVRYLCGRSGGEIEKQQYRKDLSE